MTEILMRKRRASAVGEVGLFADNEISADDLTAIADGTQVFVSPKTHRRPRQFAFAWALATKCAEACDWLETKEDAMEMILMRARHVRYIHDPLRGTTEIRAKSISFASLDQVSFTRLLRRMVYVVTSELVPGLEDGPLKAEIEAMIGPDDPTPTPKTSRKPRAPAPEPEEVMLPATQNLDPRPVEDTPPPPAEGPLPPQNADEYAHAARQWIAKQTDRDAALDYFDGSIHTEMRAKLRVSVGINKSLHRELLQHFEQKDAAK